MGNLRLGLKAILGIVLLFSSIPNFAYSRNSCESIFGSIKTQSTTESSGTKLKEKTRLKIVNWNLLNFRINVGRLKNGNLPFSHSELRPGEKLNSKTMGELLQYQKIMEKLNADIYILPETIGTSSIEYFAKHFLKDQYKVILDPTKTDTEMQIAFLVRKTLDVEIGIKTYSHLEWQNNLVSPPKVMPIFDKDMPGLFIGEKGTSQRDLFQSPDLIIFGTHLKSRWDSENDPRSRYKRAVQVQATAKIIKDVTQTINAPLLLAGDFNINIRDGEEAQPLKFVLTETTELLERKIPEQNKSTSKYINWRDLVHRRRLDAQMLNKKLGEKLIESSIFDTEQEGLVNPSDHKPFVSVFDMTR